MPKSKLFPYPLEAGTHVVAKVRRLDLTGDEIIVGTIVRVIKPRTTQRSTVSYAIQTGNGGTVEALASRTTPIDTSTPDGLDQWLDALEAEQPDPADLPGPESAGAGALRDLLFDGQVTGILDGSWVPPTPGPYTLSVTTDHTHAHDGGYLYGRVVSPSIIPNHAHSSIQITDT